MILVGQRAVYTGPKFRPGKLFEGVHYHVLDEE